MTAAAWLALIQICGGVSGVVALFGSIAGVGRILQTILDLKERVSGLPQLAQDVAYIKGRLDGRQEGIDETRAPAVRRKPRIAAVSG